MKPTRIKGNTWVIETSQLIPFYQLDAERCILLDSGLAEDRAEIESALQDAGLTPIGVLCSHAHIDHCGNNRYFQEKYRASIALTAPEAGMCANTLTLKCYFLTLPPSMVEAEAAHMVHSPDVLIPAADGPFRFCGAEFHILHTPGHSAGHVCTVTPDRVCYTADALLSRECLGAKLPYALSVGQALASQEKLRGLHCAAYLMAHRGVCPPEDFPALLDSCQALFRQRAEEIFSLIDRPMTLNEIDAAVCQRYQLFTHKPRRALRFERNIRFFVEYLLDQDRLSLDCQKGVACYRRNPPAQDH